MKYFTIIILIFILIFSNPNKCVAASFQGLGDLPGNGFSSEAFDISGDGSTVVGRSSSLRNGREAFIWDQKNGIKALGQIRGSSFFSQRVKISKDGSIVIGDASSLSNFEEDYKCFIWDKENGIRILDSLVGGKLLCTDLSSNADVIVGYRFLPDKREEAVFWSNIVGIKTLGKPTNNNSFEIDSFQSKAMSVSADGKTIAGFMYDKNHRKAFVWDELNGMQDIGDLAGGANFSLARDISADGTTVVGRGTNINNFGEAFIWDRKNGMRGLGDLKGGSFNSYAESISGDASIVVGRGSRGSGLAFIWDKENGMRNLKSVLINDYNLNLKGWKLISAKGISDDGKTIVGWGYSPNENYEAWVAKLD